MAAQYLVPSVYASITAAHAAIPADLSGQGKQSIIIDKGTYNEDVLISTNINALAGVDYIEIIPKVGDEHNGIYGSGVIIQGQVVVAAFNVSVNYTHVKNIEIIGGTGLITFGAFAQGVKYENVLTAKGGVTNTRGFQQSNGAFTSELINVVAKNHATCFFVEQGTVDFRACISDGTGTGFQEQVATANLYNCIALNSGVNYSGISGAGSNNFSVDATAPGSNPSINQVINDMKFVDRPNDYHIQADSILQAAGLDQSAFYTEDVDGTTILVSQWPAGYHFLEIVPPNGKLSIGSLEMKGADVTDFLGEAVLVAGVATINNTSVKAGDKIFISRGVVGGTLGELSSTIIDSTSFTITSDSALETSTINYLIVRPTP